MAWGGGTARGTTGTVATSSTTTVTPTGTITAGNVCVVAVANDNVGTTDSTTDTSTNEITSVTDNTAGGLNTYTKLGEWLNNVGGAGTGAVGALFACKLVTQLTASDTVTVNHSSCAARTASLSEFTFGASSTLTAAGGNGQGLDGGTVVSVTLGSLANVEHLWLCVQAVEGISAANLTIDASFTQIHEFNTGGTTQTNMTQQTSFRILTATTETFDCTWGAARDGAVLLEALDETTSATKSLIPPMRRTMDLLGRR